MNPEFISRIIGLVKTEGDRLVLVDPATGKAVVVMSLEQYEALRSPTEPIAAVTGRPVPVPEAIPAMPLRQPMRPESVLQEALSPQPRHEERIVQEERLEPRVEAPIFAPPIVRKPEVENPPKKAKRSENPFAMRAKQLGVETPLDPMDLADLTQTELLDKINRDIGDWKTAQERKRSDELQSVAKHPRRPAAEQSVEEEERFYLEPIE